ncbi:MAG TPA: hypothetical protein VFP58_06340 [Candidatus Eisenbacteria bacterium]|nr:hypothetical protein [Candidatus Eisenbacteria bacterium]
MIVYGDAVREVSRRHALENACFEIDLAIGEPGCEAVRRALIHLGEIEQALQDASSGAEAPDGPARAARAASDAAADAFERLLGSDPVDPRAARRAREDLRRARRFLALVPPSQESLLVRIPEGFAYYCLLPDSYRACARRWAEEHEEDAERDVLVLGVRSIGTTLSAVVAAALRARGFRARRETARPVGHPLARRVEGRVPPASRGIVVDEGPGLSGSSMLAAADMLRSSGIDPASIDFVPAHAAGPGIAASASARRRFRSHASYVAGHGAPEGGVPGLAQALWGGIEALRGDEPGPCEDWSHGAWRALLFQAPSQWPAVIRALERPKLLVTGASGRRVLFKYAGLATAPRGRASMADAAARRLSELARHGWVSAPLGVSLGFVATDWIAGVPCTSSDAPSEALACVSAYLVASARGPLPPREARDARRRLTDMVRVNVAEALDRDSASAALDILEGSGAPGRHMPAAGDGRMAPHEWIRTPEGRLVKTDAGGHDLDHTWVGRQPLPWDVAGTILEWDLPGERAAAFVADLEARSGLRAGACLPGYLVAYAAHRLGQCRFFAEAERDPLEREILERALERWRETLLRLLGTGLEQRERVA